MVCQGRMERQDDREREGQEERGVRCRFTAGSSLSIRALVGGGGASGREPRAEAQDGFFCFACVRYSSGTASQRSVKCTTPCSSVQR